MLFIFSICRLVDVSITLIYSAQRIPKHKDF
ncbi:hypothetical protein RJ142_CDS0034 [Klebsiella phage EKq1]|uniref:Phage protein n=1 Tax=Klebsiella phage PMBT64 TaxID=3229740 RepID=A0AB39C3Y1_9CAUD|nr:hypothetical protein RJ142_CDS0034 [Klebsiella phage EKq1]